MAITNSLQTVYPGMGQPTCYGVQTSVALSGSSQQTTSFTTTNTPQLAQGLPRGMVRVKVYNGGGSNTTSTITVTVYDGTNTYAIGNLPAYTIANGSNSGHDYLFEYCVDISVIQVNILSTLGGTTTTATMDIELVAGP
jgi:hypothetical protein